MIAAWMIGATVFTLLLGVAAFAIESALRATARQTRTPWVVALCVAVVWPLLAPVLQRVMPTAPATPVALANAAPISASTLIADQLPKVPLGINAIVGGTLLALWAVLSALMLLRLALAVRALSRVQRSAQHTVVDGQDVLVTETLGPAVVGLLQPRVAVPAWFMQLDAPLRELVLRHEREHCRSRDPQLVWLAAVSVALMPWNVGLWWLSRRLRLALEIDCDSRTLRAESNPERYGKLLLLIAQRQSGFPLSAMLAESTSHLSRRINAMQMTPLRRPIVRVVALCSLAGAAVFAACSPRIASDLTAPKTTVSPKSIPTTSPGPVFFEFQVEHPVTSKANGAGPKYPPALKAAGVEGEALAQFVVDTQGQAEMGTLKFLAPEKSLPEFMDAVRAALPNMRFEPATNDGKIVKQLVQQPFRFALANNTAQLTKLAPQVERKAGGEASIAPLTKQQFSEKPTIKPGSVPNPVNQNAVEAHRKPEHISGTPYFEYQVERTATTAPGSVGPKYPAELKAKGIEGQVLAQFVVNENGSVDVSTFRVLKSDYPELETAVRDALPTMKFIAAFAEGHTVRQLVQQPFQFSSSK